MSSESSGYPFRQTEGDNPGEVIRVDFETMMEMDSLGYLVLDGKTYKRARDLEPNTDTKHEVLIERASMLSDSLGFTEATLANRVEHLKISGVKGVEFKEDRDVPGFYQVECSSEGAKMAYAKSLGMVDRNSRNGSGAMLDKYSLEKAIELVLRENP